MWRIIGLLLMFLLPLAVMLIFSCPYVDISEVEGHEGGCVAICGYVLSCYRTEKVSFFRIFDGDVVDVVDFNYKNCPSEYVCLSGRVENGRVILLEYR